MTFTRREATILVVGDFLILVASLWGALTLRNLAFPSVGYFESVLIPFVPVFVLSLGVFYVAGLYEKQTRTVRRVMGERIISAQVANTIIAAIIFFILPLSIAPKTILLIYLLVSVGAESLWRFWYTNRERGTGMRQRALLVGTGTAAQEVFDEVNGNDRYLFTFVQHLDTAGKTSEEVRVQLLEGLSQNVTFIVLDTRDSKVVYDLSSLHKALFGGISIIDFTSFYEEVFDRVPLDHIDSAWLLEWLSQPHVLYNVAKRGFDLIFALIGLVLAAPFVLLAVFVLFIQGGTPFIWSERVGEKGGVFRMPKLRSMLFNDHGDPELQKKNRVTRFGAFLRKTRIDELPQLWNVLCGEVSFIGPRPELSSIVKVYEKEIPYYQFRHLISPGLSGWAQVRDYDAPRGGADVERTRRKLSYDLYYLKHRSFGLDIAIVLKTLRALAALSGK